MHHRAARDARPTALNARLVGGQSTDGAHPPPLSPPPRACLPFPRRQAPYRDQRPSQPSMDVNEPLRCTLCVIKGLAPPPPPPHF